MEAVQVVDLSNFLKDDKSAIEDCKKVLQSFQKTGILIVKDPRVDKQQNDTFLDMMEKYYNQPTEQKKKDARPELHYQVRLKQCGVLFTG